MMGTSLHVRMRRHTASPSWSGRPRSSTITSGARMAAWSSPSAPVCAVQTSWPRAVRPTLQTPSRSGSSSTMRILGKLPLPSLPLLGDAGGAGGGQREAEPRAAAGRIFHPDALPVGLDEGPGDGQAEARARVVVPPHEHREDLVPLAGADPGP